MTVAAAATNSIPWWREPTKDQWLAWWAAWLGWTLDAFDFTVFLLIMVPISQEFNVPLTEVTAVFTITLWMQDTGAILGISQAPETVSFAAMSISRGFMSGVLQGSWGLGFLLSSAIYGLFYSYIGWRGMLWIGVLPALSVFYVRKFVKEPPVWLENRRLQRQEKREVRAPLISIFKRGLIFNTLMACWWMASNFVVYYSIYALFATHLQKDLNLSPGLVATPLALANLVGFLAMGWWGWVADRLGRRASMIIPAALAVPIAPLYLLTTDFTWIAVGFVVQGAFGGALYSQLPSYLSERFPTEVRATASAFCYHQGAIFGGLVPPVLVYFATTYNLGFAIPMLVSTIIAATSVVISLLLSPETKGKVLVPDLVVA